jgi:hypothetical protein
MIFEETEAEVKQKYKGRRRRNFKPLNAAEE